MTKLNLVIQAGRVMREACIQRAIQAGVVTRVQFANAGRSDYKFRKVSTERERERERESSWRMLAEATSFVRSQSVFSAATNALLRHIKALLRLANAGRRAYKLENEWCLRPIKTRECWVPTGAPTIFVRSELSLAHMSS